MKLLLEPIEVKKKKARPRALIWRGQRYQVLRAEESWLWRGRWWTTPDLKGEKRRYFKLAVISPGGYQSNMEVYESKSNWVLSQLED